DDLSGFGCDGGLVVRGAAPVWPDDRAARHGELRVHASGGPDCARGGGEPRGAPKPGGLLHAGAILDAFADSGTAGAGCDNAGAGFDYGGGRRVDRVGIAADLHADRGERGVYECAVGTRERDDLSGPAARSTMRDTGAVLL